MSDDVLARARGARNPFLLDRVDSAWDELPPAEIPSINEHAFVQCRKTIEAVRDTHQSRGLLLTGDPGSGKSHLLNRLRRAVLASGSDSFVYAPPVAATGTLFVELLRLVVTDIVQRPHTGGATQLELMVAGALRPGDSTQTPLQHWAALCAGCPQGPELFARLERPFEDLALTTQMDPDVALVLRHYMAAYRRLDAFRWLTAKSVPEEVLKSLAVGRPLEESADARRALFTIAGLANARSVLVIAFDQLEALQLRPDDLDGVNELGQVVSDLLRHCHNVAVITCVQRYFSDDLKKALPKAYMDRIAQDGGGIGLLRRAEAWALLDARLLAVPELAEARRVLHKPALWPLDADKLTAALGPSLDQGGLPARTILTTARQLFDVWQGGDGASPPPLDDLDAQFQRRQETAAGETPDENIMADGLLKALDTFHPKLVRRSHIPGIQIELVRPGEPGEVKGISVCHTQNMTSLASRLKKIVAACNKDVAQAIVVRDERLPISRTAKVTQTCLHELREKGSTLLRPPSGTYSAIAAARQLLAEAVAGDLYVGHQPVGPDEVRQWLLESTPEEIKDLLAQIDGTADQTTDEVLEKLRASLDGIWVRALPEACAESGVDQELAMRRLRSGQSMVGLINGAPPVIFLRPDGLSRT